VQPLRLLSHNHSANQCRWPGPRSRMFFLLLYFPFYLQVLRSIVTMRSRWCFAFGVTSNSLNEGVLPTTPAMLNPWRMGASRSHVQLVRTRGKIPPIFLRTSCMNNSNYVVRVFVLIFVVCCKDGKILSLSEWTLVSNSS
jgi:hypothetical protein